MDVGRIGESIAARYLVERGCTVLARNWRPKHPLRGELDIIARHGNTIMFVEVKTRTGNTHGDPVEAVNYRKARALRALSAAWLAESGIHAQEIRIDVAAINLTVGSGGSQVRGARVDYLEGVE